MKTGTALAAIAILALQAGGVAVAGDQPPHISITVENGGANARTTANYDCGGKSLAVDYINVEPDHLAIVPVDGKPRIFANVFSGSGARYASGQYVWWTKGNEASLYDLTKGEASPPIMTCHD